jgi:hypothetical protein
MPTTASTNEAIRYRYFNLNINVQGSISSLQEGSLYTTTTATNKLRYAYI